jgi:hypothetical protein
MIQVGDSVILTQIGKATVLEASKAVRHRLMFPGADLTKYTPDVVVGESGRVVNPIDIEEDMFTVEFSRCHIVCTPPMVEKFTPTQS